MSIFAQKLNTTNQKVKPRRVNFEQRDEGKLLQQMRQGGTQNRQAAVPPLRPYQSSASALAQIDSCSCGGHCSRCLGRESSVSRELEGDPTHTPATLRPKGFHSLGLVNVNGEPMPPPELNNGETRCNRETGGMETEIFNAGCTRPCTEAHEADHRAYRGECCSKYALARQQAIDAGDLVERNRISQRYVDWQNATSDYSECRADEVGRNCGLRLLAEQHCDRSSAEGSPGCCEEIATYLRAAEDRARSECPGTDQDCPF